MVEPIVHGCSTTDPPGSAGAGVVTGYMHPGHAESLAEFGTPRGLPRSGGWLLERTIPGTEARDAMGAYPLFACHDWTGLRADLDALQSELVSVALVADPFGSYDRTLLDACFTTVIHFKDHVVADLREPPEAFISKHHRQHARRALRDVEVQVCADPPTLLEEWVSLYGTLIERHGITGIRAFSRTAFAKQLTLPGMIALQALRRGTTVAANLFFVQGETAYDHLTASSPEGYECFASYALKWCAIQYFRGKVRWIDWGGAAGATADSADGLAWFKHGWAQTTRPAYFCGRILDEAKYRQITQAKNLEHSRWFPAYRDGEFV